MSHPKLTLCVIVSALALQTAAYGNPDPSETKPGDCSYSKEFITALEYFRHHAEFKISEPAARTFATKISLGCSGAAQRFIKVNAALTAAGMGADHSIHGGLEFAAKTDAEANTFVAVFLKAYLQEQLDLTLNDAVRLARKLTTEFHGDIQAVRNDFDKMVEFCVGEKDLNMPKPECAVLATRVAKAGEVFEGGVAASFIKNYQFLTSDSGPALTRADALNVAERLINLGRESGNNFTQAYGYAVSSKGLSMNVREATQFAMNMAQKPILPQITQPIKNEGTRRILAGKPDSSDQKAE